MKFYKYQGTGNDFIMIDNRSATFMVSEGEIQRLCDRRFGIGADGLILVEHTREADFEMKYYNADGNLGSMCGNGGRCTVAFAKFLGMIDRKTTFLAYDGLHQANFLENGEVELEMRAVSNVETNEYGFQLDTGSPHLVKFVEKGLKQLDVSTLGKEIRYNQTYQQTGINVNFVEKSSNNPKKNSIFVRTYERGVEDETLSCGTGVTASAIAYVLQTYPLEEDGVFEVEVSTLGGQLSVQLVRNKDNFEQIYLKGAATQVFEGKITLLG